MNQEKPRLLFCITKGTWGGAQRYVYDLATRAHTTWDVGVVVGSQGTLASACAAEGISVIESPSLGRDVSLSDIPAWYELYRIFRRERPTVVHLNSSKAGALGALAARAARVPRIIFTIHGLPQDEDRSWFSRQIIAFITYFTCMISHRVICVSRENFYRVQGWFGMNRRVVFIYNGVAEFPLLDRSEARRALGIPESVQCVGSIAELHRNKGLQYLIDALARTSMHCYIIGDGEEKVALQARIDAAGASDRIHLLGARENARAFLKAFDIFCLPSIKEGLPYAVIEAAQARIPILASDLPGIREITGSHAVLLPPADSSALEHALTHRPSAESVETLFQRVRALFDPDVSYRETVSLYQ
ncbi:glycosyltransferase [bacterium]|nr:glycosyltransferase [bacterium]